MTEEENKNKLIAGVLGGMGPLATVDFMSMVTEFCPIEKEEDHVRLLVDQNPHIPSRQIMTPEISIKIASTLSKSAVNLENIGANFLVMPCNTAHKFYDLISDAIEIPFLHIVDETVSEISSYFSDKKTVGILATTACLNSEIYQAGLKKNDKDFILPDKENQEECMRIIFSIKDEGDLTGLSQSMKKVAESLIKNGADIIIAGCTEIPLVLKQEDLSVPVISSTKILAIRTIEQANKINIARDYK